MTKDEAEIRKALAEAKSIRIKTYVDLIKSVTILLGSIVIFIAIQQPESLLNRKSSEDTIARERVKLILELTRDNEDYEEILFGLSVIKNAYTTNDNLWLENIEDLYRTKYEREQNALEEKLEQIESDYAEKINQLRSELDNLYGQQQRLQYEALTELTGKNGSPAGKGPRYREIQKMISIIRMQINENRYELRDLEEKYEQEKKDANK